MNKRGWILLFFLLLLVHLVGVQFDFALVRYATKPLLVLTLLLYFLQQTKSFKTPFKKWVVLALAFSWLGDVLLLFEANASLFFLLGLSSFLMAHLFYLLFFHRIRVQEKTGSNPLFLIMVVIYYTALLSLLSPHLGAMKLPVRIYGLVISFLLLLALQVRKAGRRGAGRLLLSGAVLFVISDSVLAINKFYVPFRGAGLLIMLTYGLAQWLITEGSVRWLTQRVQKENR